MRQIVRGIAAAMGPTADLLRRADVGRPRAVLEVREIRGGALGGRADRVRVGLVIARAAQIFAHALEDHFGLRTAGCKQPEARNQGQALYR